MDQILRIPLALLPCIVFLVALVYLDSYKLISLRSILITIIAGAGAALASYFVNSSVMPIAPVETPVYSAFGAPIVEECIKAAFVMYLIRRKKIGFMVDAAIRGFAVGAGFALFENIYYLQALVTTNLFVWIIRGFGTAIMHGGTTCIFAIVSKNLMDVKASEKAYWYLPGLVAAIAIHSFFNQLFLSPILNTLLIMTALPLAMMAIYQQSERSTRHWLGMGFDNDVGTLNMIITGEIVESRIGAYLKTLQKTFAPEIVVDIFCYLELYLELSVKAKGILLMRETGFEAEPDPEVRSKFKEMSYLEKSIGKTGQIALAPFLRTSSRDLWQLYMLQE